MKAIVYKKYGPPEVLKFEEVVKPKPTDGKVLVKIEAASLNYGDDVLLRGKPFIGRFWSGLLKPKHKILGTDISGEIESICNSIKQFQPGDTVFADIGGGGFGALAEYVLVPEKVLVKKPMNISFEEAAAVPQAAVVALKGLRNNGQIKPKDKVLI